ncbi:ABC transporter ATP-binding protein [Enterococcus casseliflavus]|uniref:ATP-binding cassette domain-containing protein n=1 Tax=Enterococcus casseliflavus TaxID=37734 RepID=A0ABD6YZI8_ENTCA|nr:ABC transporter ATP-binding protein [Enterococcus casseliflavus]QGN29551.1 ATP-binding cassette domain-containing protein [Enterococcus casseliflavus]
MNAFFEVTDLSFAYQKKAKYILNGISFQVSKGGFTAIVGPNGSGKSTLFSCLSGEVQPDSGLIQLSGENISMIGRKKRAQRLAYVHQTNEEIKNLTVVEIVEMGRTPYQAFGRQNKICDWEIINQVLVDMEIDEFRNTPLEKLSGGQKQRVWLALALAQQPEVLLLDEPTNNLDIKYQLEILSFLKQLSTEKGLTVMTVLHDLNQVMKFANQVVAINQGRILGKGTPEEVLTPQNIYEMYGVKVQRLFGNQSKMVFDFYLEESNA